MRRTTFASQPEVQLRLPRGWVILGAALASWMLMAALWTGLSQLFSILLSAI